MGTDQFFKENQFIKILGQKVVVRKQLTIKNQAKNSTHKQWITR